MQQSSFRIQLAAAIIVLVVLVALEAAPHWWALILLPTGGVLAAELMNTALEKLCDRVHPQIHPDIQIAKDCAAGSVLILALTSVAVFIAYLWNELS